MELQSFVRPQGRWLKAWSIFGLSIMAVVSLYIASCTTIHSGGASVTPLPTLAVRTLPMPTRPHLVIQYCDDTTGSYYPHGYFPLANQTIAASMQQAVTANQNGMTLFATAITHNTFDPANTLNPAFTIPSVPAYPLLPTPVPTLAPDNPVFDPATATAVAGQTINDIHDYNQRVQAIDQTLQTTNSYVASELARLTSWKPTEDNVATSVLGCFQLAASRFQGQEGAKMIYIASDLENNTDVDYTQDFVTSHELSGVIVHIIYFYSATASRDQQKRSQWCSYLAAGGAKAVFFSDPAVPLSDLFDVDLNAKSLPC